MTKVRTRFSPSPTGRIHLGNARSALFPALFATKHNGVFILRIEDTDLSRSEGHFVEWLQDDLRWLGMEWQEGPGVDGPYRPYWQSQRQFIYSKYYEELEKRKLIYPCFCTDQELNLARKMQLAKGEPPRYKGTCKNLTQAEKDERLTKGMKPAWRFKVPLHTKIEFIDLVKGPQVFNSDDIGDFVVRRADGTAPFLFCNAIDDATMDVSHVLRGEDHLANTPRQIMIMTALSLTLPQYGHLSLIVGEDGAPLSKRNGSYSLQELRIQGYLPIAILNYLARLGHTLESQELMTFKQLAKHFSLERLSRSPARFDKSQLLYWQKIAVQSLSTDEFLRWLGEHVQNQVPLNLQQLFAETIKTNIEFPDDALLWAKILFHENVQIDDADQKIIKEAGEQFFVEAELAIEKYGIELSKVLAEMKQTLHLTGKKLFMPLRVALTGKSRGPELESIAKILGKEKMKHRLGRAFKLIADRVK